MASIIVARMVGSDDFGALGVVQSTAAMFQVFAGFGLGLTAAKYVAECKLKDPPRAGRIIAMSAVVAWTTGALAAGTLMAGAPWLAANALGRPDLVGELRAGSILVLLSAINGAQVGALSGFEDFKAIAVASTTSGLASFPCLVLGTHFGGLPGAVWGLVPGLLLNAILNNVALRRAARALAVPLAVAGWKQELRVLGAFSLPAVMSSLIVVPVMWACNLIVVNQRGGFHEMGIFNAANQWRAAILFVPSTLATVALPLLSGLHSAADAVQIRKFFWWNVGINSFAAFIVATVVGLASGLITASYGPSFSTLRITLIVLSLSAVITAALNAVGQIIASSGQMWWGFALNVIWAGSLLISTWFFRALGAQGFAWATLLSYVVHLITVGIFVRSSLEKGEPPLTVSDIALAK